MRDHSVALTLCLALAGSTGAQTPLSGDVNADGRFDATDVVGVTNIRASPEEFGGEAFALSDANQDGVLDQSDPERVAEIVVGLTGALPIGGAGAISSLSFEYPPASLGNEGNALAAISLLYLPATDPTEESAIIRAPTSFDYPDP